MIGKTKLLMFFALLSGCINQSDSGDRSCNLHSDCASNFCVSGECLDLDNQEPDATTTSPTQDARTTDPACSEDRMCERGSICTDDACMVVACNSIGDCPGSARTCLADLRQCSAKECGERVDNVELMCPAGLECDLTGPFRFSCVDQQSNSCSTDRDCSMSPEGSLCCEGRCAMSCGTALAPDMTITGGDSPPDDMGVQPLPASHCTPCTSDSACSDLGDGALCTAIGEGSYCTSSCTDTSECPIGFTCISSVALCVPFNFQCVACQQTPCDAGEFCDISTGLCGSPQGLCGSCSSDEGCAAGLVCREVNAVPVCVSACSPGCPRGTTCTDGACLPGFGVCDPCAGACSGDTPYCVADEARCAQCGSNDDCDEGLRCDLVTHTCVEGLPNGMCTSDEDCFGGLCFSGGCVECFQDSDCPARNICNTNSFTCEYSACAGVECQRGSTCDAGSGRCTPGCSSNQDCVLPDQMECNQMTGQCYYRDGTCDLGGDAVCAPGGQCVPNPLAVFDPSLPASCTCAKEDPSDPQSADRIGCHPGQSCNDLETLLMIDLEELGLEFGATCGSQF